METDALAARIDALERKLDLILEEIAHQRRHRIEMEDLKEDLTRVGSDLYRAAVDELEEIHDEVSTGDMLHLGKKLLRNVNTFTRAFEQFENARDFVEDFAPVFRHLSRDITGRFAELDEKGYFMAAREFVRMVDTVVTSFSAEDVRALGDNIVTILGTVKELTQPDVLHALRSAVNVYKKLDIEVEERVTYGALLRELNSPEARRGMLFLARFLRALSEQPPVSSTSAQQLISP
jgi:uncharacterized protein YjgD (DUF1641 family)